MEERAVPAPRTDVREPATLEVTKVVTAVLIAGIAWFVFGWFGDSFVRPERPRQPAIKIEATEAAAPAGKPAPEQLPPVAALLASADEAAGAAYAKKTCAACHTFDENAKAGIGPNLYGVVGGPRAHMQGFNYSNALKAKTGDWDFNSLNEWLYRPVGYVPGTRMTFAGINNARDRANVILYLRSLSHDPVALPPPDEKPPPAAASAGAPAGGSEPPIAALLASADPARGQADTMKYACIACHTFTDGGKAGIGPNLYGVVGGPRAHMAGFAYSEALKKKTGPWTYQELDLWLKKPSAYAPGTKMTLAGVPEAKDRADLIAYLRSLSANPEPLPAP
jgi:cytochrome c